MPLKLDFALNDTVLFSPKIHDEQYKDKLDKINESLDNCAVRVNFWGTRELISKNNTDPMVPLALETVANRILSVGNNFDDKIIRMRLRDEGLSPSEFKLKKEICVKLRNFYTESDAQVTNSNPITKFFNRAGEQFHPLDKLVDLIASIFGAKFLTVRQRIEEYYKS